MAIFTAEDRFLKWNYKVEEIYLLIPEQEPIQLPNERLVSISILHDYENNIFPLFRIELVLEPSRYYLILDNKETIQFKLRIQKFYHEIGKKSNSLMQDFINDTFDLILNDSDFDTQKGFKEEEASNNYSRFEESDINDLYKVDNRMEFFLFKSDTIKSSRKIVNKILNNASLTDGINYICTQANLKNMLMAPLDHKDTIAELVIPPLTALQALIFLDTYYGFYKVGSMIYFDFTRNYIIPFDAKCRCWEPNERKEVSIVIPKRSSNFSSDLCTVEKDGSNVKIDYIVGDNLNITIKNDSITYDILAGNDIQSVNVYDGTVTTGTSNAVSKNGNTERLFQNLTENPYFNDIYTQQTSARSVVIELPLADFDASLLRPNIIYHFIFEDTSLTNRYKGYYKLVNAEHSFIKDGSNFSLTTRVRFKQMSTNNK